MTRFISLDHAYEDAWNALPHSTPEEWFQQCFGTADFLDIALRAAGHEATTHFTNGDPNYQLAIANFVPDVIISTAASRWGAYEGSPLAEMRRFNPKLKLVLFCSHRVDDYVLQGWDVIFSSFPWMVDHCKSLGVRCEYLPLAFGRPVLDRIGELPKDRDIPVAFIGGLGSRIWDSGTKTMAAIAEAVPSFKWWGYKLNDLHPSLERTYQGQAWGLDMYRILARTKICVNRHGEIAARGGSLFGNNMRQYEASGMGCILFTDHLGELQPEMNAFYYTGTHADVKIISDEMKSHPDEFKQFSDRGVENILANHCFENRMVPFLNVVENL